MPPSKYRFLTYGRLSQEFKRFIEQDYPQLECIQCESRQQLEELASSVNALAGFDFIRDLPLSHIKWFHSFAAGVNTLISKDFPPECIITRTSGQLGPRIGEYCLAYILHDLKGIDRVQKQQQDVKWEQFDLPSLKGQRVLILGTGTIGAGIAKILSPLCDEVAGASQSGNAATFFDKVIPFATLGDDLEFNIVINALPLTELTRELVNSSVFKKFRDVLYINVGRGATTSEYDLLDALQAGNVRRAVLDVFETEPLPASSGLWTHPSVVITPHHSGLTTIEDVKESFREVYPLVVSGSGNQLFVDLSRQY